MFGNTLKLIYILLRIHQGMTYSADTCCKYESGTDTYVCRGCQLKDVPDGIPTKVRTLDLSHNNLTVINNSTFVHFSLLVNLHLSNNRIGLLRQDAFKGLNNLRELDVRRNQLCINDTTFNGIFKHTPNLVTLQMVNNNCGVTITSYPNEALRPLHKMKQLSLPYVKDTDLGPAFSELTNLKYLMLMGLNSDGGSLGCNVFKTLENTSLEMLSVRNSGLQEACVTALQPLKELEYLNLACNKDLRFGNVLNVVNRLPRQSLKTFIADRSGAGELSVQFTSRTLGPAWRNVEKFSIRSLNIGYILLGNLNFLSALPELKYAGFPGNMILISYGNGNKNDMLKFFNKTKLETLDIGHFGGLSYTEEEFYKEYCFPDDIHHEHSAFFHQPPNDVFPHVSPLKTDFDVDAPLAEGQFILRNLPLSIKYLYTDFFSFGSSDLFRFKFNPVNQLLLLNVSNSAFFGKFQSLKNATNLQILDGQNCGFTSLDEDPLQYMNLRKLILSGNKLKSIGYENKESPFKLMTNLQHIDLSNNIISYITPTAFKHLPLLEDIILQNNTMKILDLDFKGSDNITFIDVSQNEISSVSDSFMKSMDKIAHGKKIVLDLTHNQLHCSCIELPFIRWFLQTKTHIKNRSKITCYKDDIKIVLDDINTKQMNLQCIMARNHLSTILKTVCISILIAILVGLLYKYRWKLQFRYYTLKDPFRKNMLKERDDVTENRMIDIFISCAEEDSNWLYEEIVPQLEEQWGYRSFSRRRDVDMGDVKSSSVVALDTAAVQMCVISPNFCEDVVCCWELEMILAKSEDSVLFLYKDQIDVDRHAYVNRIIKHYNHLEYGKTEAERDLCLERLKVVIQGAQRTNSAMLALD